MKHDREKALRKALQRVVKAEKELAAAKKAYMSLLDGANESGESDESSEEPPRPQAAQHRPSGKPFNYPPGVR